MLNRLVISNYTKTNLLLAKAVVVVVAAVDGDYGRVLLSFPGYEVHPCL